MPGLTRCSSAKVCRYSSRREDSAVQRRRVAVIREVEPKAQVALPNRIPRVSCAREALAPEAMMEDCLSRTRRRVVRGASQCWAQCSRPVHLAAQGVLAGIRCQQTANRVERVQC